MTNPTISAQFNKILGKYNQVKIALSGVSNPAFLFGIRSLDEKLMGISNELSMVNTWIKDQEFAKLEVFFDKMRYFSQELDDVMKLIGGFTSQSKQKAA